MNDNMDREITPESMQFGRAFPRILHEIWEADPYKGPVRVSKMDVTDDYHRVTLHLAQVNPLPTMSQRQLRTTASSSASTSCFLRDGLNHPSISVQFQKNLQTGRMH